MENNPHEIIALGQTLRQFRLDRKFSQEQLGFLSRLDRTYISGIERGVRNPSFIILNRIMKALNVTPVEFFTLFDEIYSQISYGTLQSGK